MGVPNVVYNWKSLRTLYISVFVMNVFGCLIVVVLIVSAVKLRMGLGQYLDLVLPGEANFWPGMIFLISFLCAPIYAIGIKLCLHLRFAMPESVSRLNNVMFIHCMLCFASMIIVGGIVAIGIHHMVNYQQKTGNGIIESMQDYATEVMAKIRIDAIQIKYRCCGSKSFKDWFHVRWMERDGEILESRDHNRSTLLSTDVPFSCCAAEILRPCIHHNIMKPSEAYLYRPEHRLTIATNGCHAKVLSHARFIDSILILALILLAAYQMLLALLSRLLHTAHSNALYIGPKKSYYIGWIIGHMPSGDTYKRLIYDGGKPPVEEMVLLQAPRDSRTSTVDGEQDEEMDREEEETEGDKVSREESSKTLRNSNTLNVKPSSFSIITSHESRNQSMLEMYKRTSNSPTNTVIPTPPPTPSVEIRSDFKTVTTGGEKVRRQKVFKTVEGSKKWIEVTKPVDSDRPTKLRSQKSATDGTSNKRKCLSRGPGPKVNNVGERKESRKSLECLSRHKSPWKIGSSIIEEGNSPVLSGQLSRVRIGHGREENSSSLSHSRSSLSLDYKRYKITGKDSIEEDEMRMRKFCRDLSTEYKKSPYLKQRKDFSEQCGQPDATLSRIRKTDDGRVIRNEVCARFNPADSYSRFRGSLQDSMMRRGSQTQSGPPPIPIPGHRTAAVAAYCGQGQPQCRRELRHGETPHFHSRPFPYQQLPQLRDSTGRKIEVSSRLPHQRPASSFCTPAPTYFPIPSRPSRLPRLPPCSHAGGYQSCRPIPEANVGRAESPCMQNELDARSRYSGGWFGPPRPGQPPRFSCCYDRVGLIRRT